MNELTINNDKVTVSEVGLVFREELTHNEWADMGRKIGRVTKASLFILGDWVIYGEQEMGGGVQRTPRPDALKRRYAEAAQISGIEESAIEQAAYVCRNVPVKLRRSNLYFSHHKEVAKLEEPDQVAWLDAAEKHKMGKRRLRRSIDAGRIVTAEEMEPDPADNAIETFIPWVNRICVLHGKFKETGYIDKADKEKRDAMRRDLFPVVEIYEELANEKF